MLYTLKYIYNNDLDKKYVNVKIVKNTEYYIFIQLLKKKGSTKEINSYIIAVCSKCKSTYRFNLKHISNENEEKYEVKEGYVEVSEYVYMEK